MATSGPASEELRLRNEQLALLARVSQLLIIHDHPENDLLTAVFGEVARSIGAEMYFNYQPYDETSMRLCTWGGLTDDERTLFATMRYGELLCGHVAARRQLLVVEDIAHTDVDGSEVVRAAGYGAYAGFPLLASGQLLGTIAFITRTKTHFADGEVQMIQTICDQTAAMLERTRLMRALRKNEERLRLALEGAGLGTWDVDLTTGAAVWDRRHHELQGYEPGSVPASLERWLERIPPKDAPGVMAEIEQARRSRGPVSIEHRLLRADTGEPRWLSLYGRFVYDTAGAAVRFSGVSQDITARKQAEEALRLVHQRLETTLEASQVVLFHQDRALRYTWIHNPALGYVAEEVIGKRDGDLFQRAEDAALIDAVKRSVIETGVARHEEVRIMHDGEARYYDLVVQPDRDARGAIAGVNCAAVDVTERRQAEARLRDSEERFRTLADNMSQLAWMADEKGWIFWYNRRWFAYTGTTLDEVQGWGWKKVHHPDHVERVAQRIQHSWDTGEPWEDTFPLRAKDGAYRWFLSRALPIRDQQGEIVRWFGTNTDVTEQRRAEEALREADRKKDEFLATLAHELRNPLAPLRTGLHVLRTGSADGPAAARVRDMMDRQLTHMVRLIDDLLDVSRISRGKVELQRRRVGLRAIVEAAVDAAQPHVTARRHQLSVRLPDAPVWLDADETRMAQVFGNLLTNAAKYTLDGGRIALSAHREGGDVIVAVTDTGMGIPADMLEAVFEMFAQVNRTLDRAQGGLGIGLALVRRLVEMHGGAIKAESPGPGRGSTFTVRLPAAPGPADRAGDGAPRPAAVSAGRRVLVVDDNLDAAESLAELLQLTGHDARTAPDGPAALEAARAFAPELVLCDLGMPGMDGYEVARRLRADPMTSGATLVALTGWGGESDRRKSAEAGFDLHLTKPVEVTAVADVLARLPAAPPPGAWSRGSRGPA